MVQEYIAGLDRDLRVMVIGNQVYSYWRVQPEGFLHNISRGQESTRNHCLICREGEREEVRKLCRETGLNLAAFDLIFSKGINSPLFLEVNYTFGWAGLGGMEDYESLLNQAIEKWLALPGNQIRG